MAAQQLIKRRVFDDAGNLLREGLVDKDIPNTRADLMRWWTEQDRLAAEEEAAAAEAEAKRVEAEAAAAEAHVVDVAVVADTALARADEAVAAVGELRQMMDGLTAATPEEIARVGVLLTSASTAALAVEGAALKAMEEITAERDAVAAIADETRGLLASVMLEVGQFLSDARNQLASTLASMFADGKRQVASLLTSATAQIAAKKGPKGDRGRVGQGMIAGAGKRPEKRPDGSEWTPGDSWVNTKAEGFTLEFMDSAGDWSKPTRWVPAPKLFNATQNVVDMAPRTTVIQNISGGGGGGGGGERLLASAAARSASVLIGDASNWAPTGQDPQAGQLLLCITAADGPIAGRKGYAVIDFVYEAHKGGGTFSEHSILGELSDAYTANISVSRSPATVPPGITTSMPTGATATKVFLQINPQGGTTSGVNNFFIEGLLLWVFKSQGRADAPQNAQSAAWVWQ